MLLNKQNQIKYIGFNDFWFIVFGSVITSTITDYLFNGCSFLKYPLLEAILNWSLSLFFCVCNWFIMRSFIIFLRKKFPEFKDSLKRILWLLFTITASILLVDQLGQAFLSYVIGDSYNHGLRSVILIPVFLISIMITAIYEAIYYYNRLKQSVQEEEQAKQVLIQSQLDALRNQAQPHFLFNSLNTLRDIIDHDSKEDAKLFVNKLSDVYKFILESGNANLIPLRSELKFAKAYIHIQQERFGSNLKLDWQIDDVSFETMIAPMSLQLLLENAIKHNVASRSNPLEIIVKTTGLKLQVENKLQPKSTKLASTKIGLKNIQKRYSLLSDKLIEIEKTEEKFMVTIPLLESSTKTQTYEHSHR